MEISRHLRSVEELLGFNAFYWRIEPGTATVQRHLPPSWNKHPLGTQCHSFIHLFTVTLATWDKMTICYKNPHKSKWDDVNIQTSKHKIKQAHRQGRIHLAWESGRLPKEHSSIWWAVRTLIEKSHWKEKGAWERNEVVISFQDSWGAGAKNRPGTKLMLFLQARKIPAAGALARTTPTKCKQNYSYLLAVCWRTH